MYTFTIPENKDHATEGRLSAYVCFDSKKYSDKVQAHKSIIDGLMKAAGKIDAKGPVAEFRKLAGKAQAFLCESRRTEGKSLVKPKSASFEENRAGLFVMLESKRVKWEAMMTAYDEGRLPSNASTARRARAGVSTRRTRTRRRAGNSCGSSISPSYANSQLSSESGLRRTVTVEGAVSSLDCVQVREYHGIRYVTEIDRR